MATTRTLDVPGARLHYEVRGEGPFLLLMGSPMGAADFAAAADALAGEYTVVTHDPRGVRNSPVDDPEQDTTPELRADDVAALLDAVGAEKADVLGSSGGAATVLALAERHPGRVRTAVAHEPPLLELLPEAAEQRAATEDVIDTFHRDGAGAAWMKFMANAGFDMGETDEEAAGPPEGESSEQDEADAARFFAHELRGTTRYRPDTAALKAGPVRVVVGIGADSGGLITHRTSTALAGLLGVPPVEFPGGHTGFIDRTEEFARVLRKAIGG
ncbi:alpha/beta fold hydrolase [Nocardiopsis potens]|uniref:alpha/beta fold hydrolase n=1 Tax=Nocardiopsis potens TaxID=1246458 RepID=UPI0003490322|nr:alpha/beta hydrolase [Nocardiopsis potens]